MRVSTVAVGANDSTSGKNNWLPEHKPKISVHPEITAKTLGLQDQRVASVANVCFYVDQRRFIYIIRKRKKS
jgi:hypothetical protein